MRATEKVLFIPDMHIPNHDGAALQVVLDFKADWKPTKTIVLGDFIDAEAASTFARVQVRYDQRREYKIASHILDLLKPNVMLEGNHEERFRRPGSIPWEFWEMLRPERWFELKRRKIQWVPYSNEKGKIYRVGKVSVVHGFSTAEFATKVEAQAFGCVVHGHTHRISQFQPKQAFTANTGFNIGCLCKLNLPYQSTGLPRGWAQGFAYGYFFKNGDFSLYQVRLIGNKFAIEGRVYER